MLAWLALQAKPPASQANKFIEFYVLRNRSMDPQSIGSLAGWIGGVVGCGIGVAGGIVGTYFTLKNTNGPRERAFAIKASIVGWIFVVVFVAAMCLIPTWHKHLLWIPYTLLLLWGIRVWNRTQFRIRNEEKAHSG
jgi:hypothetical protein